jgi:HDOD domain
MNAFSSFAHPTAQREADLALGHSRPISITPAEHLLRQLSAAREIAGFGIDVQRIAELCEGATPAVQELTRAILAEPFIALKILRSANVVRDLRGNTGVTTVSKAIVLLGLEQVRALVLSTLPVDRLKNPDQASCVRAEITQSAYAARLAREIATRRGAPDPEEAAICALLRGCGRLMAAVYLYASYEESRIAARDGGTSLGLTAAPLLGMELDQLGVEALVVCGLPERIVQAVRPCPAHPRPSANPTVLLRTLSECCENIGAAAQEPQVAMRDRCIEALLDRFTYALGVPRRRLQEALRATDAREHDSKFGRTPHEDAGHVPLDTSPLTLSPWNRPGAALTLGAGVASLLRMLERGDAVEARLTHAARVLQRAYEFQRVILCLKDAATGVYRARVLVGKAPETAEAAFGFKELGAHDLFNAAVAQGADIYIRDVADAKLQQNLPLWFKLTCPDAKSFLLLSIASADGTLGFFYADHARANRPGLTHEEVEIVKTLKQLTWVAVRQEQGASTIRQGA